MSSSKNDDTLFSAYLDSIYSISHSVGTVHTYKIGLNHFRKFIEENYPTTVSELVDSFKTGKLDVFKTVNEFMIYLDKQGKQPPSINLWMAAIKGFLRYTGVKIYAEDFKQRVRLPKERRHREEPLTKEVLIRLLRNLPLKLQTAVLFAIASGARVGEIVQLRISDIDFDSKPTRVRIRAEITKTKEARETFLTTEATKALKDYLSRIFSWKEGEANSAISNIIIFGRMRNVRNKENDSKLVKKDREFRCTPGYLATCTLLTTLARHIEKIPELSKLNENGRRMVHFHAFRKYFRTTVGDAVGRDFAEALMGHHFYLDTYYLQSEEKRREMYLKAEPYLTISDYIKIEKDLIMIKEDYKQVMEFCERFGFKLTEKQEMMLKS
jgi:integrase